MRLCANNHGTTWTRGAGQRRLNLSARVLAIAVIAAVGCAQFFVSWHEMTVRHVRCAEHGEATHVAARSDSARPEATRADGPALESRETEASAEHEHCAVAFVFRGSTQQPVARVAVRFAPPPTVARHTGAPAPRPGRAFVLASAPKTSPPAA